MFRQKMVVTPCSTRATLGKLLLMTCNSKVRLFQEIDVQMKGTQTNSWTKITFLNVFHRCAKLKWF